MRTRPLFLASIFLGITASAGVADAPASIDRFHFLAGLSVVGARMGHIAPPQCESFFREGGEQRSAELFLAAARALHKSGVNHHYNPAGKRLVIEHPTLAKALQAFYASPDGAGSTELGLIHLERNKRLSFVAGIYARSYRDGAFHGTPSAAMRATVLILLAEGCEVSQLVFSEQQVPETLHFQVKLSKAVADVFAAVDNWRPPHVEWQQK
jgi:hypothetical protein